MMWQDLVFMFGSAFSIIVLVPTLRDAMSSVPLGTSIPSATIGTLYGLTFLTMGMPLSAGGSLLTGVMWSLIAMFRAPDPLLERFRRRRQATETHATFSDAPADD